jgi:hypothetical protein
MEQHVSILLCSFLCIIQNVFSLMMTYKKGGNLNTSLSQLLLFSCASAAQQGHGLPILEVSRPHTATHYSRQDSSGREIRSSQSPVPNNTQQSQQTNIHALGGIGTHNSSRRAAVDLSLRPRGHWTVVTLTIKSTLFDVTIFSLSH